MAAGCVVGGSLAQGVAGSRLSGLPPFFCCSRSVCLTGCSAFVQGGAPLSTYGPLYREERHSARTVLCTGRGATQHGPLYREERHSARSFVLGAAPLSTVLSSVFPGVGVDGKRFHGDLQIVFECLV